MESIAPELVKWLSTMVSAGIGAWLSVRYLPLKAKKDEWYWEKQRKAESFLLSAIGKINFLTNHTLLDHYADEYSMAGKCITDVEKEVITIIKKVHEQAGVMQPFISNRHFQILERFLVDSKNVMDVAKETWGLWDNTPGPEMASEEYDHSLRTLSSISNVSDIALTELQAIYRPSGKRVSLLNWGTKENV